ncbi:MAG: cytochrome c biogenesis CcdA family protein [Sphingomicrobium sp.]
MEFGVTTYALGLLAGMLSTLSPCVLPLLPILVAAAVSAHRWGAVFLGIGLALSFTVVGVFVATLGASLGIPPETFRTVGAVILALFGLILIVPRLQELFAGATSLLTHGGSTLLSRIPGTGVMGQFGIGAVLGIVWSPCVGPTLGAATTLASQGRNLAQIVLLMLIFGIGAAAPLVLVGSLPRARMMAIRGRLLTAGRYGKQLFGIVMMAVGILIVTGVDRSLEVWVLDRSPIWLTQLTTRF